MAALIVLGVIVLFVAVVVFKSIALVPQAEAAVIERLGRYARTASGQLTFLVPFVDRIRAKVDLRERGAELIARSQRAQVASQRHPAFARILSELYPDEARMVRFLAVAGTQPAIDIRTKTLFQVGSERLASRINMIAEMSSCQWPEHSEFYLGNLERLGLVTYSPEPVDDFRRYALMEVQPRAMEVFESCKSAISIYRSILLTQFGREFSAACFDVTGYNAGGWDKNDRGDRIKGSGPPEPKSHKH